MRHFQYPGRSPVMSPNAMASTSHPLSTTAALDILRQGGTALDAATAAVAVQCVVEPQSTSIGGDCFCLYAPADSDEVIAINGSGRAPAGLEASWLREEGFDKIPQQSAHSVTVPTAVDAWVTLNRDHGRMSLGDILAPSIGYARDGYAITPRVAFDFSGCFDLLNGDDDARAIFLPEGRSLVAGDAHRQPALAATLSEIAEKGRDGFYTGWVAEDMLAKLNGLGGKHTQADLDNAIANYVTPIKTSYRGYNIFECPPNGQGLIALLLLNMVEGLDKFGDHPINLQRIHHEIEAGRLAYRDRSLFLADPDFVDVPVDTLIGKDYAKELAGMINPQAALHPLPDCPLPRHKSTVYISVVDKDRNACSFINTVYHTFGAGLVAPKSGVLFQCRGMGFTLEEGHPNCIAPNKRPLHTIIPGMVKQAGRTVMPFGVMGGEYQAFGHMQFLSRLLHYGMDIQEAQDCPRFFPDPFSTEVEIEAPISDELFEGLRKMGHHVVRAAKPVGGSQAIWIDPHSNMLIAGSDPRKDGQAAGY